MKIVFKKQKKEKTDGQEKTDMKLYTVFWKINPKLERFNFIYQYIKLNYAKHRKQN